MQLTKYLKSFSWKQWVLFGISSIFALVMGTGILTYWGVFGELPNYYELKNIRHSNASEVISDEGVILGKFYIENRTTVNLKNVSPYLTNALVATEDSRFFEHHGFDWRSFGRVIFKSVLLRDESAGGGSTITQQLAKNLFPRKRYWFGSILINKWREILTALRIEKVYTKNEILNLYLNTVPFSDNIYGIEVACHRFFETTPKDIKPEEAAVLVGMLKGNYIYHPKLFPDRALARRNVVLDLMVKHDFMKKDVCERLKKLPLKLKYSKENQDEGLATYFRENLRLEVSKLLKGKTKPDGQPYDIYRDGLRIYTTISSRLQRYAEDAVKNHLSDLQKRFEQSWGKKRPWETEENILKWIKKSERYKVMEEEGYSETEIRAAFNKKLPMTIFNWSGDKDTIMTPLDSLKYYNMILNVGVFAIDPVTGYVKVWVGGSDFTHFKYDHIKSSRQAGSTFKPFVYTAALEQGINPCSWFADSATTYSSFEEWRPDNADDEHHGYYSLPGALAFSKNTISVQVIFKAGISNVIDVAERMGITSRIPEVPSIALGTADVSLWDMVTAYGTLANRGKKPTPRYLKKITTKDGEVLVDFDIEKEQIQEEVVAPDICDMMNKMMMGVVNEGTAKKLRTQYGIIGEVGGKTGTTQDNTDGWFIGYKPKLVTGVWVGADNPIVKFRYMGQGQGSSSALPIWGLFMHKVQNDKDHYKLARDTFQRPAAEFAALMNCPLKVAEPPSDTTKSVGLIDKIKNALGMGDKEEVPPPLKPAAILPKK